MMDRLRRFLDELDEDILEDRPEDRYNPEGLIEYESVPDEDEDEDGISDELEDGDSSEERVDVSPQKRAGSGKVRPRKRKRRGRADSQRHKVATIRRF
jgi:hypothetical protein